MSGLRWFVLIAVVAGCRAEAGSRCEAGEARCVDAQRALVCENGRFIETPCRGAKGCQALEAGTSCDIGANRDGDRCSRDEQGAAACVDSTHIVVCRDGRYVRAACLGPGGCAVEHDRAVCDQSRAQPGDACEKEGKKACSSDGKTLLACSGGRFSPLYPCRGEKGCTAASGRLDCDVTLAIEGDGCDTRMTGHIACAADRRSTLICRDGRFVRDAPCRPGTHCEVDGTTTRCVPKR